MASNKSKTPGPIQVVVVLMLSVLAFYFGNRFGQVFDFNTMEITDGALATVNSIVAAPAAISTASVPMLYAIGLAITVLIVWLYTFMYAGNYRYGEEAGSAKWGTLKEGVAFKDQTDPSNNLLFTKNYGLALKKPKFDLEHDRNLNVMVIGGSGSGKTRNYVKPNLMGNMFQESGCHPTALNSSSGAYGICQWLGGRKTGLENLAKEKGKDMSDLSVQLDWFWEEFAESCSGWNKAKYKVFCAQSDLKQCVYLFRSQFERCGESEAADANRLAQAQRIYDALGTSNGTNGIDGNGQDLKKATRRQKDVVNAANTTKSPGQGWCAAWVTNVFQSAGIGYFGGNACDMCRAYCTSTNVRDLKVGMIIADVSHPGTGEAGRLYGHVGIYIGDNKVISNEGAITIKSLQEFVGFYGKGTGCKWGWLGGVDLSK